MVDVEPEHSREANSPGGARVGKARPAARSAAPADRPEGRAPGDRRYVWLLAALFLLLVVHPFLAGTWLGRATLEGGLAAIMLAGTLAVGRRHFALTISLLLALPSIVLRGFHGTLHWDWALLVALVTGTLFMLFNAGVILRNVLGHRGVTRETILGAVCVYVLVGLAFALGFLLFEHVRPGSFHLTPAGEAGTDLDTQLISFSFVTLTTVGYGDVTPIAAGARALCNFEALFGQIYLAVLVARLVGIHIAQGRHEPRSGA